MPTSKHKRARGKHFGNRVHHTGNKFILTSGEAQIIQAQLGQLQEYMRILVVGLHTRLAKLEPPVPEIPADSGQDSVPTEV